MPSKSKSNQQKAINFDLFNEDQLKRTIQLHIAKILSELELTSYYIGFKVSDCKSTKKGGSLVIEIYNIDGNDYIPDEKVGMSLFTIYGAYMALHKKYKTGLFHMLAQEPKSNYGICCTITNVQNGIAYDDQICVIIKEEHKDEEENPTTIQQPDQIAVEENPV